jgi:hypothetical protein
MEIGMAKALARLGFLFIPVQDASEVWSQLRPVITEHRLIRVGSQEGDGGYLLPDLLSSIDGVFSAGIAENSDFELYLAEDLDLRVDCLDASISSMPQEHKNFTFLKKFLGTSTGSEFISLDSWLSGSEQQGLNMILKIDIEGFEYESLLLSSRESLDRFKILVIELHSLEQLGSRLGLDLLRNFVSKITTNHTIVHAHANNIGGEWSFPGWKVPAGLEVTLLRKDAIASIQGYANLPHPLDKKCVPGKPEVVASWT